jgi:hypothetical protein
VRVLFDNGGGNLGAGALEPTYEAGFTSWPPHGAVTRYYLGARGTLGTSPGPSADASFRPDPSARPATDLPTGNAWAAQPPYDWTTVPTEGAVAFETPPFATATTVVGPASLDLWLKSTAAVTDLQATVTEVRSGETEEEYITSGFLRSTNRTLAPSSTTLAPVPTYRASDRRSLRAGQLSEVRIPIDPIGHTFRPGTRLRVVISAPGGDRPAWAFDTPVTHGSVTDTIALGGVEASSLALNVVTGVTAPAALPACGALRGEPCRAYVVAANQQ